MSRSLVVLSLSVTLGAWGCAREAGPRGQARPAPFPDGPSVGSYFAAEPPGVDTAGARLVPIPRW